MNPQGPIPCGFHMTNQFALLLPRALTSWTSDKLAAAVWTNQLHFLGARFAKGAFITANESLGAGVQ